MYFTEPFTPSWSPGRSSRPPGESKKMLLVFVSLLCVLSRGSHGGVLKIYNISGAIPYTSLDFFFVPFFVPPGALELQVDHLQTDVNSTNILDWGLNDANGAFRGWGGGNVEPAIVGIAATSRSYILNASDGASLPSGNWSVVVGKARIAAPPGHMSINITIRDAATLPAQPERGPYVESPPLDAPSAALTWYSGDFHIHCRESGDAFTSATLDEVASYGASAGLDFVHISDHNTVAASSFMVDAQSRHPHTLLLPGVEFTTYNGHGGALFTTQYVDHKLGTPGVSPASAAAAIHAQGGLFSVNHLDMYEPGPDMRNLCVGCTWDLFGSLSASDIDAIEIGIQSWQGVGFIFSPQALELWDHLHALGFTHIAPIGGSDDHHGGANESAVGSWHEGSPIGSPTTQVLAANLSHAALREGVASGRTIVKMNNASDPNVDLTALPSSPSAASFKERGAAAASVDKGVSKRSLRFPASASGAQGGVDAVRIGGFVPLGTSAIQLTAAVSSSSTGGGKPFDSAYIILVRNNEATLFANVTSDPFSVSFTVPSPIDGIDRWRLELHDVKTNAITVITNHIFFPAYVPPAAK